MSSSQVTPPPGYREGPLPVISGRTKPNYNEDEVE